MTFYKNLSADLNNELTNVEGLSERNLRYMTAFYSLYSHYLKKLPQPVAELSSIPWGHHSLIIDKCKGNADMAIFYVNKVHQENWSRVMLLNFISTDLFEREGKSQSNFANTLPESNCPSGRDLICIFEENLKIIVFSCESVKINS